MNPLITGLAAALIAGSLARSQAGQLPCGFSGPLLKTKAGTLVTYTPKEMKARARRKVDLSGLIRNADLKGTARVDSLIGTSGDVVGLQVESTHPLIKASVERALCSWIFRQVRQNGKPVAYLGKMEFVLCNINCGERGASMTLLK